MLYLCRGALSSEARFIVSLGIVWFGDRVVYPGLPSKDRAAKHMGKSLLARITASAETSELPSEKGRRQMPSPKTKECSTRTKKKKTSSEIEKTAFDRHFLKLPKARKGGEDQNGMSHCVP